MTTNGYFAVLSSASHPGSGTPSAPSTTFTGPNSGLKIHSQMSAYATSGMTVGT